MWMRRQADRMPLNGISDVSFWLEHPGLFLEVVGLLVFGVLFILSLLLELPWKRWVGATHAWTERHVGWLVYRLDLWPRGARFVNETSSGSTVSETCEPNLLCSLCQDIINRSCILRGSPTRICLPERECFGFHRTLADLQRGADSATCHMCSMLWHGLELGMKPDGEKPHDTNGSGNASVSHERTPLLEACNIESRLQLSISKRGDQTYAIQLQVDDGLVGEELVVRPVEQDVKPAAMRIPRYTNSDEIIRKIKGWIATCSRDHDGCDKMRTPVLPTRLLFVGDNDHPEALRLIETSHMQKHVEYLALSHCWGGLAIANLTMANQDQLRRGIDINTLPRNFREAITITRALNLSYLWIDSLCIMQDSPDDWERESVRMNDVYTNATCTIAATASKDPSGGCFRFRNPLAHLPLILRRETSTRGEWRPLSVEIRGRGMERLIQENIERSPLNQRGWAFQERALSARVAHFCNDAVIFECDEGFVSDLDAIGRFDRRLVEGPDDNQSPEGQQEFWLPEGDGDVGHGPGSMNLISNEFTDAEVQSRLKFNWEWYAQVRAYTARQLTRKEDRLVALSGVAGRIAEIGGLTYMAGLWGENLVYNLLWVAVGPKSGRPPPRNKGNRLPTWSWGSVDGPIDHIFAVGGTICRGATQFRPEQLARWVGFGPEAVVLDEESSLGKLVPGTAASNRILERFTFIELGNVWMVQVIGRPQNQYNNFGLAWRYYPDVEVEVGADPIFYLARLCEHVADFAVCHGLVLRRVASGTQPRGPELFQRVGCFRLGSGLDQLFRNAKLSTIRIV